MPIVCKEKRDEKADVNEPIFLLVSGSGILTITDMDELSSFLDKYLQGESQFKLFINLSNIDNISMELVKYMAQNMNQINSAAQNKALGTAIVVKNKTLAGVVNMIFSISKPSTPTKITTNIEKACDFLNTITC